jgi:hypothetical protein
VQLFNIYCVLFSIIILYFFFNYLFFIIENLLTFLTLFFFNIKKSYLDDAIDNDFVLILDILHYDYGFINLNNGLYISFRLISIKYTNYILYLFNKKIYLN